MGMTAKELYDAIKEAVDEGDNGIKIYTYGLLL